MGTSKKAKIKDRAENNNQSEKKARVLAGNEKKPLLFAVACVVLIVLLAAGFYRVKGGGQKTLSIAPAPAEAAARAVAYPAAQFADGKARHFDCTEGGRTIRYFILQSADGVIRAAFDACDVCWPEGRGYYQEGDNMVCKNCGRRFASVKINEIQGGCNPAPLARTVQDGQVIINVGDILAGQKYFNFGSGR
ncbi:MAG: DUF2318 domain-containing protein [Thermodesulfobacteriota bacterium]|nr:DUF2318 domain-containing protein [Thermodesulfobacteriota bacterium]